MLEIINRSSQEIIKVNLFWLRDHCRCLSCYNCETKQRKYNLLDIPRNIKPKEGGVKYLKDGQLLEVTC